MPNVVDKVTGKTYAVDDGEAARLVASDSATWSIEGGEAAAQRLANDQIEEDYGGIAGGTAATIAGAARGLSSGGSDILGDALGVGDDLRKLKQANRGLSTLGEIGGSLGGALTGVGAAGAAAKLGAKVGAKGTIGAVVKGGLVEGGLTGLGTGVSELALSEEPLTLERATSVLSSNLLYGAAIGGGANLAGKVLEKGIVRAKGALDEFAAARSAAPDVADDLAGLDAAGLRTAREAEVERLVTEQTAGKAGVVDEIKAYRATVDDANPWLVVTEGEPASLLNKSKKTLRNLMDDPEGLAKNPAAALKALRVQEQGLSRALADTEAIGKRLGAQNQKLAKELAEELATLPDALDSVVLPASAAKRYGAYADVRVPKGGTVTVNRAQASEFLDALSTGRLTGSADEAFAKMPGVLQANRELQAKIEGLTVAKSELVSGRLTAIDAARDGLTGGGKKGVGEQMAGGAAYSTAASLVGAVPVIGPFLAPFVGAKAASLVGEQVFGRLGKATTEAAARTSKAVGAFLDVTKRITPVAPVLASKVLGAVRYAPERPERSEPAQGKPTLASAYKARSEEIRSQTAYAPDGSTVMRPQARQAMAAQLAPIRAVNPIMADRMETLAARRLEFLASKLPRRPDLGTLQAGPDRYQPSDLEMRTFARYAAGVEDPGGIEERLAAGQITPEDAQVMREVYPERLADITRQIVEQLPTLRATLPYQRRLALSILTGVAVDASMHPRVLAVLQSQFAAEEGTDGGTQAPRAQAQFGSVKSTDKATPAQERAS